MKMLIGAFVAALAAAVLAALVIDDPDAFTILGGADRTTIRGSTPPTTPTSSTGPASPTAPTSGSSSPSPAPSGSTTRIVTSETFYFGRPFETISIDGRYQGGAAAATLRVQLRRKGGWTEFPLPVVTQETGSFRAYVELGRGEYRLRIVDPETGTTSRVVTLLLF